MVNAGCEIPSGTPVENLRALCEWVPYRSQSCNKCRSGPQTRHLKLERSLCPDG